jgi:hypothetical protein
LPFYGRTQHVVHGVVVETLAEAVSSNALARYFDVIAIFLCSSCIERSFRFVHALFEVRIGERRRSDQIDRAGKQLFELLEQAGAPALERAAEAALGLAAPA